MIRYEFDTPISPAALADLREAVGWNRMERDLADPRLHNAFHLCAIDSDRLVGYVVVVSNGVTDAYIQDLMVHPDKQKQGVGRELMQRTLARLRSEGVYMVSVIYGEAALQRYYEELGFYTMLCGQLELRPERDEAGSEAP
ncbi:MAG: GNAT family N-acetyltransferase [Clostridia bacterium]|nr:GNAT family N-acetyltransferase [Clostridia bacterium]